MKTLVMYGEAFGAEEMIPVTAEKGHLVTSFGLSLMKPVYDLMDQLIEGGAVNGQKFSVDPPRPLDPVVPTSLLQKLVFMNNPLCGKMPVATSSNKLRTYSSARYYTDAEMLRIMVKGEC